MFECVPIMINNNRNFRLFFFFLSSFFEGLRYHHVSLEKNVTRDREQQKGLLCVTTSPDSKYVVGGSTDGCFYVWRLEDVLRAESLRSSDEDSAHRHTSTFRVDVQNGSIYDIKFSPSSNLFVATDQGILTYEWSKLLSKLKSSGSNLIKVKPSQKYVVPQVKQGARGALGPIAECNSFVFDGKDRMIVAAGDRRAYVWDLNRKQPVTALSGHSRYLHSVAVATRQNMIFTGSEDGNVRVWDRRDWKCQKTIRSSEDSSWVSSLAVDDDDNWLVSTGGSANGGFVRAFHLPTLVNVSSWKENAAVNDVQFTSRKSIVTVDSDAQITVRSCLSSSSSASSEVRFRARSSPNLHTAHLANTSFLAVAGSSSPYVDIYPSLSEGGSCAFSLQM